MGIDNPYLITPHNKAKTIKSTVEEHYPLNNPTAYFPNSAFAVLFNDLCEQQTRPCLKSWASFFACTHWLTEDQLDSCQIGCKTIGADVNRASKNRSASLYNGKQSDNQFQVALLTTPPSQSLLFTAIAIAIQTDLPCSLTLISSA